MTKKDGKFYCDICKDDKPIPVGTGFWLHPNPLGFEHAHQVCYHSAKDKAKKVLNIK
jgi:hypothetical protein